MSPPRFDPPVRALVLALLVPGLAAAADYKCQGSAIKSARKASTYGKYKSSGSSAQIMKTTGQTMGSLRKSGNKWTIKKRTGSTVATTDGRNVYKTNGATWTTVSKAKSFASGCPDHIAAGLWALAQSGNL